MPLPSGARFGVYEIIAPLGAGGMGEVYRARDIKLNRDVAIKILPAAVADDPERLARFDREARVLATLNHPHIAQIHGLQELTGSLDSRGEHAPRRGPVPAIVMEFVDGETLADRIARGGIKAAEALALARQIAAGLDAAHEKGIVHRDLKPSNIALTNDGSAKILDFGLATDVVSPDGAIGLTRSPTILPATGAGVLLGTAPYMSPEQARGKGVDKRTDIWAFGCVIYEMLTGRRAFGGDTASDTIAAILEREPDWNRLPPSTPPSLRRVVERCLDKDVKRRLRDIGDALLDLEGEGPADMSRMTSRSTVAIVGWAVAGILGAIAIYAFARGGSSGPAVPTVSRLVRVTSGPAMDQGAAISPDGKWVAYLSNARGPVDVWVKFISGGDPVNLTAAAQLDVAPQTDSGGLSISPDGALIAFNAGPPGGNNTAIGTWVIPAPLGGTPRKILDVGRAARWSPDGKRLAYIVQGGTGGDAIWIADADGANPRELAPRRGGLHKHWPAWSHDSRYVYFNYSANGMNAEPSEIYRVPADGGPIEPVVSSIRRAVFPALTFDGAALIYAANPRSVDLGLWWQPLNDRRTPARQLTVGIGEYAEPTVAPDGRRIVATLFDNRQALIRLTATGETSPDRVALITQGDTGDLDPTLAPSGTRLVFSSTRSGNRNLWSSLPDGSDARPLTSGEAIDERPAFAPDGQRVAFVSDRGGARGIWLISAEGGSPRQLAKAQVLDSLSWSPDGTRIVFAEPGDAAPRLSLLTVASGVTTSLPTPGPASGPAWSPRGDVIAYIESRARPNLPALVTLQFVTPEGKPAEIACEQPPNNGNAMLAWAPDGRVLASVGNSGSLQSVAWMVEPGNGTRLEKLIEFPADTRIRGVAWSKDGSSLILGRQKRDSDIVLLDLQRAP